MRDWSPVCAHLCKDAGFIHLSAGTDDGSYLAWGDCSVGHRRMMMAVAVVEVN